MAGRAGPGGIRGSATKIELSYHHIGGDMARKTVKKAKKQKAKKKTIKKTAKKVNKSRKRATKKGRTSDGLLSALGSPPILGIVLASS
jgi:hypothetical protein